MTAFYPGSPVLQGQSAITMSLLELRVISNLIQEQSGLAGLDDLRFRRNDEAFGLGIVPPVVPGQ